MAEPLQLSPTPSPQNNQEPLQLSPYNALGVPSEKNADDRATKASLGLTPIMGVTRDQIKQRIASGDEAGFRQQAASIIDTHNAGIRQQQILNGIQNNPNFNINSLPPLVSTNPDTVIENHFSKALIAPSYNTL